MIGVASKFAATLDREYVLQMASCLTNEATQLNEDDGFTQKATIKAGMKNAAIVTIKPTVDLAPFRTFPEVGQPVSPFVFRARTGEGGPQLMLVEADGGRWKLAAIKVIQEYLTNLTMEIAIAA